MWVDDLPEHGPESLARRIDEEIGASLMVGRAADHDGGAAFDGGLVCEGKGD
jgi:hypothetical protein